MPAADAPSPVGPAPELLPAYLRSPGADGEVTPASERPRGGRVQRVLAEVVEWIVAALGRLGSRRRRRAQKERDELTRAGR